MEKYKLMKEIGDGTCGNVYKALNIEKNEIVAIKKMKRKFYFWEDCMNLREAKSLRKMNHPNIVKLKEIVRENHELFFIFEHMEQNLYQVMRGRPNSFTEGEIRSLMSQVLQGLAYMHKNGYFHRDLKPENLLVTHDVIKIADFGLAREVMSDPPYTDYVSTRWYRAPEILLKSPTYTPAIDMWAVGAILAELYMMSPLFPGESEVDQLYKICSILGTPDSNTWREGMTLSHSTYFNFFQFPPANLSDIIPNASLEAIDLILKLCSWDPQWRPSAEQALLHPFFHVGSWVPCSLRDPFQPQTKQTEAPKLELNLWDFGTESDDCFLGLTLAVKPSIPDGDVRNHGLQQQQEDFMFYQGYQDHSCQQPAEGSRTRTSSKHGDFMFYTGYQERSNQSDHNITDGPNMSSFPPAFFLSSQAGNLSLSNMGVEEPSAFAFSSTQQNLLDNSSFGPMMTLSSPMQRAWSFI